MLFNSLEFAVFFPIVTALYFLLPHRLRWAMLLLASCIFYMAFVPQYVLILLLTILIDYFAALYIVHAQGARRRGLLVVSIISTCLVLFVFKYFNFFNSNIAALARFIGWNYSIGMLELLLPIGLSFHTFQSLSYVIEVYRGNQKPERHFGIYALYVMFYPQLVAGPIERPQNLLHQIREHHRFDYLQFTSGLKLMAWGLFKKVVIADRLAIYVNGVYADPTQFSGPVLVLATVAFAYQIYCDFSGYSDIAIGTARVMGFKLMNNFRCPYFSQSIAEFWQRWHISLSTWFRDYVYLPLGGSRVSRLRWCVNISIVFLISGLWHGANWTFVVWGCLNGFYIICGAASQPARQRFCALVGLDNWAITLRVGRILITFALTCLAWVFFRANTLSDAGYILTHLWKEFPGQVLVVKGFSGTELAIALLSVVILESVQILSQTEPISIRWSKVPIYLRWPVYYAFLFFVLMVGVYDRSQFIYFQF